MWQSEKGKGGKLNIELSSVDKVQFNVKPLTKKKHNQHEAEYVKEVPTNYQAYPDIEMSENSGEILNIHQHQDNTTDWTNWN